MKNCRNKPMTAATFSSDGSVLAVAAENVITLWDPDNNTLVGVIAEALSVLYYSSAWTFAILFRLIVWYVYLISICSPSQNFRSLGHHHFWCLYLRAPNHRLPCGMFQIFPCNGLTASLQKVQNYLVEMYLMILLHELVQIACLVIHLHDVY